MKRSSRNIPKLKRSIGTKLPKTKFILYCEGRNTEPSYFRALADIFKDALVEIQVIRGVGVPQTIADAAVEAAKLKKNLKSIRRQPLDSYETADEVWAVFDRDTHPCFDQAVKTCEMNGIGVAQSNPCFELWLVLHFEEYHRPCDSRSIQRYLESKCPEYKLTGSKSPDCKTLVRDIEKAERHAENLLSARKSEGSEGANPSTTVHKLIANIRKAIIRNR